VLLLGGVSVFSLAARVWRIGTPGDPGGGLIFDEKYYVNAARVLLRIPIPCPGGQCGPYATITPGIDPTSEHPPLGKLLIAAGMQIYGDNPFGWRFFPVVFGTLAILAIYWLVRAAGGGPWLAVGAASLMATDNLFLVHGRIATLDIFVVTFMLAGVALYLRGRPILAGVTLGLGACVKLVAPQALIVLLLLELGRFLVNRDWRAGSAWGALARRLTPFGVCLGVAFGVFALALTALDLAVKPFHNPNDICPGSGSSFDNFFVHTRFMLCYATKLTSPNGPVGIASYPWQWLINQGSINYFTTSVSVSSGGKVIASHTVVAFRGEMNPAIILLALPALAIAVDTAIRYREDLSVLAVAWFAATYLPFLEVSLVQHRTSYLYYMVVVLPAVYIAVAQMLSRRWLPRAVLFGYIPILGYEFLALYPFRTLS
jgi:dolichyl-phosphate-mannose-protein mannosyltransferase